MNRWVFENNLLINHSRVQHIFGAFSPDQIRFLIKLVRKRRDDENHLEGYMTPDELYALELLEDAVKIIGE